jgi:hypothetical protein
MVDEEVRTELAGTPYQSTTAACIAAASSWDGSTPHERGRLADQRAELCRQFQILF